MFNFFSSPTAGSLIRPEKIGKYETLAEAIHHRYLATAQESVVDVQLMQEAQDMLAAPFLEVVGMDKIRKRQGHMEYTNDITIVDSTINAAGVLTDLTRLTTLCLKSSCISDWKTISDILMQIPSLKTLDISDNRIMLPRSEDIPQLAKSFHNLDAIIMNSCGFLNWNEVLHTSQLFPNIKTLSVKDNGFQKLQQANTTTIFMKLQTIILNGNPIVNFEELWKLGNIASLEELLCINTQLTSVKFPKCNYTERLSLFPALQSINLRDNMIVNELEMFNELDKLPCLTKVSYQTKESFESAVGMMEQLQYFNRSRVDKTQRNECRYEMWKKIGAIQEKLKTSDLIIPKPEVQDDFNNNYRCYPKMFAQYGNPTPIIQQKRSTTIEVQFKNVIDGKMLRKKLPRALSIHTLYGLIYKIAALHTYKMDLHSFKLYYVDAYNNNIKVYMDNLSKTLDYYSLQNGDTILIEN